MICSECSVTRGMLRRWKQDCAVVPQVDFHPRLEFESMREFRIQAGARSCQSLQNWRSFKGAVNQHAAGGMRGFAARFSAFDNQDCRAAFARSNCEGEADDAPADDDYVPSLHLGIVKEAGVQDVATWKKSDRVPAAA